MKDDCVRVILVTGNVGSRGGGEPARPMHYFVGLRGRGVDVHLIAHARSRRELAPMQERFPDRIHFVEDRPSQRLLARIGRRLPDRAAGVTTSAAIQLITQGRQRRLLREMLADGRPAIVHQPFPISPAMPSRFHGLGAPVIIGPLNGNIDYPPAFRGREGWLERMTLRLARGCAGAMGAVFRGKREASLLLVANRRTAEGLPHGSTTRRTRLTPNAVEEEVWRPRGDAPSPGAPVRFVFLGRLVAYKGVDHLLEAAAALPDELPWRLDVVGDGRERPRLERLAVERGIAERVRFRGWLGEAGLVNAMNEGDAFVFPSLREAGGAAVLEAMAMEMPVIAADWGGPADFLTPECGVLVPVSSRDALIGGLARAMEELARDPGRRRRMGRAGRERILSGFLWEHRIDALLEQYARIAAESFPEARLLAAPASGRQESG